MHVIEKNNGTEIEVEVRSAKKSELKTIKRSDGFIFNWKNLEGEVYKLIVKGSGEIVGLLNIISRPEPQMKCIEVISVESKGASENKSDYKNVAGCLFAFAAKESFRLGFDGYLFLIAKTKSAEVFHGKYGFKYLSGKNSQGVRMGSDGLNSFNLTRTFLDL